MWNISNPSTKVTGHQLWTRRDFAKLLLLGTATVVASCSPIKYLAGAYPDKFKSDQALQDTLLRAFVKTIVPGADVTNPDAIRIYKDDFYPFKQYAAFFLADLASRSQKLFGSEKFDQLNQHKRERVLQSGLEADATIARLYRGAIMGAKASIYAGIYDDGAGCPHIGFHGSNFGFTDDEMFYPNAKKYFARTITLTGNPN